ncbi:Quinohemoprotein alcohol dehydrogenase ADH IIB precursor [Anatilimnocola aggregata]|uniref:Quinohemoprotein alcohol dehydrogenase ADH IIB n=1 Tax=Anatilimnocola aggregata TaxID=2528021 RepID=A0A517YJP9_9BACT|nr:PQQ-binding-like beta-propeller repeat protein [Anatilimnocola aggregata]QDU30450.1 Quinohemoprotein alcohol dehydrogenase ADH IIB precursor [Anatilimnocola aggregata]
MSTAPNSTTTTTALKRHTAVRQFPPIGTCLTVLICLTLIPLVQIYVEEIASVVKVFDGAVANIVSLILAFIAFMTLWIWFCWKSAYSFGSRRAVFAAPLAGVLMAVALLRFEGVDGYMKPTFVPRWYPQHENELDRPTAMAPAVVVPEKTTESPASENVKTEIAGIDLKTETPEDFAQFLGPQRNNWLPEAKFADRWEPQGPREVWRRNIGPGWSGFAVRNGYAVTLEQRGPEEWVSCYRVSDGQPVWHHACESRHYDPLGGLGPRATPTIDGGRVYAQSGTGRVQCLDGETGKLLWEDDLLKRYDLTQATSEGLVKWGRSGSPLIVDNLVVVPAGGYDSNVRSLIAYDKETGKVAWEAGTDQISYASPIRCTVAGVDQIVSVNEKTLAAYDPRDGQQLWQYDWSGNSSADANVSQAFPVGSDQLFISKGYGQGSSLLKLVPEGDKLAVNMIWESRRVLKTKFTNVTIIGDYAYGLSDGILECVHVESGKSQWKSGRYGHGQVLGIGDQFLVLGEDGELVLLAANPEKAEVRGKIQAFDGKTWNNLCVTGKLLLIRNGQEAACYEIP